MDEARSNNNVVYRCTFHVVWCPKYRRKVITGDAGTRLKEIIRQVCEERGAHSTELETMPDHVHLLVECDPQYGFTGWSSRSRDGHPGYCGRSFRA